MAKVVNMERAMSLIRFPDMRRQVAASVRSLSDVRHQRNAWGRFVEGVKYYDDLTLNVHVLYDDCMVLPEPRKVVHDVIYDKEVPFFESLEQALGPMLVELGDAPDQDYTSDPRWNAVVEAAAKALSAMEQYDQEAKK